MKYTLAMLLVLGAGPASANFSCRGNSEPACLEPGAVVCVAGTVCIDDYRSECGFQGLTCSKYVDECADKLDECSAYIDDMRYEFEDSYEELQSGYNDLVEQYNELRGQTVRLRFQVDSAADTAKGMEAGWREMRDCVLSAATLEDAKSCAR